MDPLLFFIVRLLASSGLLTAFYFVLFRGKSSYRASRLLLLCIPLVSVVLSLVSIEGGRQGFSLASLLDGNGCTVPAALADGEMAIVDSAAGSESFTFEMETVPASAFEPLSQFSPISPSRPVFSRTMLPFVPYGIVMSIFAVMIARQMLSLRRIRRKAEKRVVSEAKVYLSREIESAFSVLRSIYVNTRLTQDKLSIVISHEKQHIAHRHYIDLVVVEFFTLLMWFNPFVWIIRREIRNVHEYEADRGTIEGGVDMKEYMLAILEETAGSIPAVANPFRSSMIKKRFLKMKTPNKIRLRALRAVLTIPFVGTLMMFFAFRPAEPAPTAKAAAETATTTDVEIRTAAEATAVAGIATIATAGVPDNLEANAYDLLLRETPSEATELSLRQAPVVAVPTEPKEIDTLRRVVMAKIRSLNARYERGLLSKDELLVKLTQVIKNVPDLRMESRNENDSATLEAEEPRPATLRDFPVGFDWADHGLAVTSEGRIVDVDGVEVTWPLGPAMQDMLKSYNAKVISAKRTFVNARQHPGSHSRILRIERSENETRVVMATNIYWPENWIFANRETCLIDRKNGDRYMIRRMEGDQELGRECILRGLQGRVIEVVEIFPPLDQNVEVVDYYEPDNFIDLPSGNNSGETLLKDIKISDYEPKPETRRGRVIR